MTEPRFPQDRQPESPDNVEQSWELGPDADPARPQDTDPQQELGATEQGDAYAGPRYSTPSYHQPGGEAPEQPAPVSADQGSHGTSSGADAGEAPQPTQPLPSAEQQDAPAAQQQPGPYETGAGGGAFGTGSVPSAPEHQTGDPHAASASQPGADPYAQPGGGFSQPGAGPYAQPGGYSQPSADPYAQPGGGFSQPSADPYAQPGGYSQPSANQYGYSQPGADPYGQPGGHPGQPGPMAPGGYPGQQGAGWNQGGPAAGTQPVSQSDEKTWGTMAHVGMLVGGFVSGGVFAWVVPLILFLIYKDRSPWLRYNAVQSLNFGILVGIVSVVSAILTAVLIGFLSYLAIAVVALIFGIQAAMKANNGEFYKYPLNVSFVK